MITHDYDLIIVLPADMHAVGYCNRVSRLWALRYHLDWWDFILHGIPASKLLATGDALAPDVVAAAILRLNGKSDGE